jgi:hypothetical protein
VQLPVLEKLGLVSSTVEDVDAKARDGTPTRHDVRRFRLTDAGNKYFLPRGLHQKRDLCAARLSLDKVVSWELSAADAKGPRQAVVTYTYHVDAFPWTANPEVRRVFPAVDRVILGAETAQLTETLTLTADGWVANDLLETPP